MKLLKKHDTYFFILLSIFSNISIYTAIYIFKYYFNFNNINYIHLK